MGKTKTKLIDDSVQEEVKKPVTHPSSGGKKTGKDELVEKLKAELGMDQKDSEKLSKPEDQISGESDKSETTGKPKFSEKEELKKPIKPGKSKPRSKKYQEISKDLDRTKTYSLSEAVDMVKKLSYSKFNATLEAHINTAQTGIRGLVSLPYASGKTLRILAFPSTSLRVNSKGAQEQEYEGVIFGDDSTIEEINKGVVNFDLLVSTPEWMPKLAKVARILGPRGLMPNPKSGTITDDLKKAVEGFQAGKTEYKTEPKAPVIHLGLGKLDQPTEELSANIKTLLQTLGKSRVKKVSLSPTMGPSVKLDLSSL